MKLFIVYLFFFILASLANSTSNVAYAEAKQVVKQININVANEQELMQIKGIGKKKAQAIIDYREKYGDFKSVKDLAKVKGIGKATVNKIANQLTID